MPTAQFIRALYRQLIPFFLVWLFVSVPLAISMATEYRGYVNWYVQHEVYFNIPENLFFLFYVFKSWQFLTRVRATVRDNFSSIEANDLSWFKHLLIGFAIIIVADTMCTIYELFYPMIPWNIGTLIAFSFVILYSYLGYKGMFQSQILLPDFFAAPVVVNDKPVAELQQKKPGPLDHYSAAQISSLKASLDNALEHRKLFLNETLSLSDLAKEMSISPKKLSELLNQHLHISFYNLINEYRIKEVISRMFLPEYEKYTLAGLAFECGFQSKATFNRIFKQKTGKSPSDYKEMCRADKQTA